MVADARTSSRARKPSRAPPSSHAGSRRYGRILRENIEDDGGGGPREKRYQAKEPDLLVSPIDLMPATAAKSDTKGFTGYKSNVTES